MAAEELNVSGKKVFFLYPHSVIQENLIEDIFRNEYEIYLLKDHKNVQKLLKEYNNSLLFINIDDVLTEPQWEEFIREIMNNPDTKDVLIGILSYNDNKDLAKKYLMDIMVPCGFIRLKLGIDETRKIILKTLEANEVKGLRKYVRIKCEENEQATFNINYNDKLYNGKIMDISSVGMACTFNELIDLKVKSVLQDIQMRLKGIICSATGIVVGFRSSSDKRIFIVMFGSNLKRQAKAKIHNFIYRSLQDIIEKKQSNY